MIAWLISGTALATDEIQSRFDAAMQAIEEGRLRTAREELLALLDTNPSLHRARLELARVHYFAQDYAQARAQAQIVLDDPETPPAVRTTVLAFLAQIDADERRDSRRHQWTPSIYAGLMYDSNVNVGPSRDLIDIGGLPFIVTPESREQSDFAWVVNPAISHVYNPGWRFESGEQTGRAIWQTDLSGYYRSYFDEDDFNFGVVTLRTGPAWIVPQRWRAWIALQGDQIWLDNGSLAFFTSINPGATWEINRDTELTVEGALVNRHYWDNQDSDRDGWEEILRLTGTRYFQDRRLALQAGVGYSNFEADADRFGYQGPDIFVGAIYEAWTDGLLYARVGYRKFDFDGREPLFDIGRDDDELRYTVGFQHLLREGPLARWALQGDWTFTDNDSDVAIYEYDRHVVNLGLARAF
ncbi:MAG: tetratricopeptide repeat protein [Gammaproteobacteria bacterium]|nr:tetratricopeptide repeat protein [Gammaproteobacteria bacterium]